MFLGFEDSPETRFRSMYFGEIKKGVNGQVQFGVPSLCRKIYNRKQAVATDEVHSIHGSSAERGSSENTLSRLHRPLLI